MKKPQAPFFSDPNAPVGMSPEARGWRLLVHVSISVVLWFAIGSFIGHLPTKTNEGPAGKSGAFKTFTSNAANICQVPQK